MYPYGNISVKGSINVDRHTYCPFVGKDDRFGVCDLQ
ncbi:MAG: hypothetical protein ACD_72C00561G0009, partial [uncultured bacterium]